MQERQSSGSLAGSGPNLIAWLSLCLLAAAWGRTLDDRLQIAWSEIGTFGLIAAVGLEAIHRTRAVREQRARERAARKRMESGISRLLDESATLDAMNLALRKLVDDVARRKGPQHCASGWTRRHCEAEILRKYPLEIAAVGNANLDATALPEPRTKGYVRQLASNSISFEHEEALNSRIVLATFRLSRGEQFVIVVDVLWTERDGDGYLSGGTVLAAGAPDEVSAESCQATSSVA